VIEEPKKKMIKKVLAVEAWNFKKVGDQQNRGL